MDGRGVSFGNLFLPDLWDPMFVPPEHLVDPGIETDGANGFLLLQPYEILFAAYGIIPIDGTEVGHELDLARIDLGKSEAAFVFLPDAPNIGGIGRRIVWLAPIDREPRELPEENLSAALDESSGQIPLHRVIHEPCGLELRDRFPIHVAADGSHHRLCLECGCPFLLASHNF